MKKIKHLSFLIAIFAISQSVHGMNTDRDISPTIKEEFHSMIWGNLGEYIETNTTSKNSDNNSKKRKSTEQNNQEDIDIENNTNEKKQKQAFPSDILKITFENKKIFSLCSCQHKSSTDIKSKAAIYIFIGKILSHVYTKKHMPKDIYITKKEEIANDIENKKNGYYYTCKTCNCKAKKSTDKAKLISNVIQHLYTTTEHNNKEYETILKKIKSILLENNINFCNIPNKN